MLILTLAATFLAGVLAAYRYAIPLAAISMFGITAILLAVLLINLRRPPRPAFILAVLLLGMMRAEASGSGVSDLTAYHSRFPVQVEGVVTGYPEPAGAFTRLQLRVEKVKMADVWIETSGDVLVTLRESAEIVHERERPFFRYGDRLLLEGPLEAPPVLEDFDYPVYLSRQGIGSVMSFPKVALLGEGEGIAFYNWLYDLRHSIADSLAQAVPEPQAAVAQALLLGIGDNIPDELKESFRVTGTSHVLADSCECVDSTNACISGVSSYLSTQHLMCRP